MTPTTNRHFRGGHMLIWRAWYDGEWRAARAINGSALEFGESFATWREAMDYALRQCGR